MPPLASPAAFGIGNRGAIIASALPQRNLGGNEERFAARILETTPNLDIREGMAVGLELGPNEEVTGVRTYFGITFACRAAVLTTGTFMNGRIWVGRTSMPAGRLEFFLIRHLSSIHSSDIIRHWMHQPWEHPWPLASGGGRATWPRLALSQAMTTFSMWGLCGAKVFFAPARRTSLFPEIENGCMRKNLKWNIGSQWLNQIPCSSVYLCGRTC